jgi:hypothetical protein
MSLATFNFTSKLFFLPLLSLFRLHGDQIGRIFTLWATFNFVQFALNLSHFFTRQASNLTKDGLA